MFLDLSTLCVDKVSLRTLAHLGDGVYELVLRETIIKIVCNENEYNEGKLSPGKSNKVEAVHRWTSHRSSAVFQVQLLKLILPNLTEAEIQLVKRARNMPVSIGRRSQQAIHRQATGFEALIGYWHCASKDRLIEILTIIQPCILAGEVPERQSPE